MRREHSPLHDATISQQALEYVEHIWADPIRRLQIIPGKEALSALNKQLQEQYNVNLTPTSIIDAMRSDDILCEIIDLIHCIDSFNAQSPALATKPD